MKARIVFLVVLLFATSASAQWEPTGESIATRAGEFVTYILMASGGAAWLAASLKDSGVLKVLMPIINFIGGNVGKAKNNPADN